MVEDHLKKVKVTKQKKPQNNEVYFQYLKWVYNKKSGEEKVLNLIPKTKLLDQRIKESFGHIPKNCQHIRSSFFIWRKQK